MHSQNNNSSSSEIQAKSKRNSFARRVLIFGLLVLLLVVASLSLTGQSVKLWPWLPASSSTIPLQQFTATQTPPASSTQTAHQALTIPISPTPDIPLTATPSGMPNPPSIAPNPDSQLERDGDQLIKGTIILSIQDGPFSHLFAYHPQRLPFIRLTAGGWDDIAPAVSPDGKQLAFSSNRSGHYDLYLLDLISGETRRLTDTPQYDGAPSWSPDGRWLVYESYQENSPGEGNLELFIRPVSPEPSDSAPPIRLTDDLGADSAPVWSPAGRQIAFVSTQHGDNDIWLADLDQIDNRFINLSHHLQSPDSHPAWSPDGSRLLWSSEREGIQTLYTWEPGKPEIEPQPLETGGWAAWSPDGHALVTSIETPNHTFLSGFDAYDTRLLLAPVAIAGSLTGLTWTPYLLAAPLPAPLEQAAQLTPTPLWQPALSAPPDKPGGRQNVVPLNDIRAPFPYLHDLVDESFFALRQEVIRQAGWDFLSNLENAYVPLTAPLFPGMLEDWLYTGRAFAANPAAANAGWMVVVREDFGSFTYWHVYLRTRLQDGTQGLPLGELPWDFNARNRGDLRNYEQGGSLMEKPPAGYWLDFTRLAASYGWERLPALSSWRIAIPAARYNEFVNRSNPSWYAAMLEIYPPDAIITVTPPPPPTSTPTKTPFPSRTPTPTQTLRASPTPTLTLTTASP